MRLQVTDTSVAFKPCRLVLAESIQPVLPGVQGTIAGVLGGSWIKGDGVFAVPEHVDCKAVSLGGGTLTALKKVLRSTLNVTSEEHKLLKAGKVRVGVRVRVWVRVRMFLRAQLEGTGYSEGCKGGEQAWAEADQADAT
jgi:hypothetical protein